MIVAIENAGFSNSLNVIFYLGPCYYAGDAEGGKSGLSDDYDSVIEGKYTDYQVAGLFSHEFIHSQFEDSRCIET